MKIGFLAAMVVLAAAARGAEAQGEPPYEVSLQPVANDSTSLTLTWRDGWWNGFASAIPLDATEILGSTTPWDEDIDAWADTVAQPMEVENGVIPAPSLEAGGTPGEMPIGTQHTLRLINLQDGATYYVAVRGVFGSGAMSIGPEGSAIAAVAHDPGPPGDPALSVSGADVESLRLQWVAPGDDASGPGQSAPAQSFVVGLGWTPPGASIPTWINDPATVRITGASAAPGEIQRVTFGNLNPAATYYAAIQVSDERGQASIPASYLVASTLAVAAGSDSSGCPVSPASTRGFPLAAPALLLLLIPVLARR